MVGGVVCVACTDCDGSEAMDSLLLSVRVTLTFVKGSGLGGT